jgi:WD40 repeat protein
MSRGALERKFQAHNSEIKSVLFRYDGEQIASAGGRDGTIKLWNPSYGILQSILDASYYRGTDLILNYANDDCELVAVSDNESRVFFWEINPKKYSQFRSHMAQGVISDFNSPNEEASVSTFLNQYLVSGSYANYTYIFQVKDGKTVAKFNGIAVFRADGQEMALACQKDIKILDLHQNFPNYQMDYSEIEAKFLDRNNLQWRITLKGHIKPVLCLQYNPEDNNILVSGSEDGGVKIWDLSNGTCLRDYKHGTQEIQSVFFFLREYY